MSNEPKKFKASPKRFHPKGFTILYEDFDIIVINKSCGLLTISTDTVHESTAHFLLSCYVKKGNSKSKNRVFIVHRLDKDASGVLIFAKTEKAKRYLQDEWSTFKKTYCVAVVGQMPKKEGVITSYLAENSVHKMYSTQDPKKGKLSETAYRVVKTSPKYSLLEIDLRTGRKNQIRVHCVEQGCPVVGDKKYGVKEKGAKRLALHSTSLVMTHPHTKKQMEFKVKPPGYFKTLMNCNE